MMLKKTSLYGITATKFEGHFPAGFDMFGSNLNLPGSEGKHSAFQEFFGQCQMLHDVNQIIS
jgi:hypothetical protein